MLSVAREKEARRQRSTRAAVAFHESDIQSMELGRQFDACVMMFAVLSYQTTDSALAAGLAAVRRSLRNGGLFLCDFWYAPAVLAIGPSEQRREFALGDGVTLRRISSGQLLQEERAIEVSVKTWELASGSVVRSAEESHRMRYFFEDEFKSHLSKAGLELVSLTAMPTLDSPLSTETWNAFAVARAK
jgi:SAM-dependent methyltransferase